MLINDTGSQQVAVNGASSLNVGTALTTTAGQNIPFYRL
jgi:hypothetical protein